MDFLDEYLFGDSCDESCESCTAKGEDKCFTCYRNARRSIKAGKCSCDSGALSIGAPKCYTPTEVNNKPTLEKI